MADYTPGARVRYTGPWIRSLSQNRTLMPDVTSGVLVEHCDHDGDDPHWVVDWRCPEGTYRRLLRVGDGGHRLLEASDA